LDQTCGSLDYSREESTLGRNPSIVFEHAINNAQIDRIDSENNAQLDRFDVVNSAQTDHMDDSIEAKMDQIVVENKAQMDHISVENNAQMDRFDEEDGAAGEHYDFEFFEEIPKDDDDDVDLEDSAMMETHSLEGEEDNNGQDYYEEDKITKNDEKIDENDENNGNGNGKDREVVVIGSEYVSSVHVEEEMDYEDHFFEDEEEENSYNYEIKNNKGMDDDERIELMLVDNLVSGKVDEVAYSDDHFDHFQDDSHAPEYAQSNALLNASDVDYMDHYDMDFENEFEG